MKILIVDDSRAMRMIMKKALRQAGFGHAKVSEAEDGNAALRKVAEVSPDLVLTDWNMPGMGGQELLRGLREAGFQGVAGVVSSAATTQTRVASAAAGAGFVIAKPFTADALRAAIEGQGLKGSGGSGVAKETNASNNGFDAEGVQGALAGAFRRELTVASTTRNQFASTKVVVVSYEGRDGPIGVAVCDPKLALSLGAALSLIPPGMVEEALKTTVPDNLRQNVHEVFNLLLLLVGSGRSEPRVADVTFGARAPALAGKRLDLTVTLAGYGTGKLTLVQEAMVHA